MQGGSGVQEGSVGGVCKSVACWRGGVQEGRVCRKVVWEGVQKCGTL